MRSIALLSIATAVAAAALGIWVFTWWYGTSGYRPLFKPHPPQTVEFVQTTSDLEHLRKFTQLQMRQSAEIQKDANTILDGAINMVIFLLLTCAVVSLLGWVNAIKAHRLGQGGPLPGWLKWL